MDWVLGQKGWYLLGISIVWTQVCVFLGLFSSVVVFQHPGKSQRGERPDHL